MRKNLFSIFKDYPDLVCVLSEKKDGSMRLLGREKTNRKIRENRKRFLKKLGIEEGLVTSAGLIHGSKIKIITKKEAGKIIKNTDGLLTSERDLFLSITVADCLPIFLYERKKKIIGLIHGGWRSLAKGILFEAVKKINKELGGSPRDILAGIGPGISQCHFEVKNDVLERFNPSLLKNSTIRRQKKLFLDLKKIAQTQLINLGLKKENIEINSECTFCLSDKYFSYRREKPKIPKTMIAIIGLA